MMKLHLGCGERRPEGYTHIDALTRWRPDQAADALYLPCHDDVADEIYFCHGLEHIPRLLVQQALAEWRRVMKLGGLLRLAVPDFEAIVTLYQQSRMPTLRILGLLYGRQDHEWNFHYSAYDYETLAWELQQAGYYDIEHWVPECVFPEGYDDYSYAKLDGICVSLNVVGKAK